ncbi:hypothetical protein TNCT_404431 [Trichonephila clavata]|uniref:Uncharacterized protein n=1 Tax=Trichonephila clavata TaxID=2740835 RepID=A0A8X6HCI6_TRICU|nr:hypothetical protein TNCT_404431 [Trichonephila clavata]
MQCLIPGHNGMVFQQCILSTQQYNASNLSMDSRIPSLSRNASIHTTKCGLKLSMNILRTLTSNTGSYDKRSLRPLVASVCRNDTEKVLFPPLPPPWIVSSSPAHAMSL